MIRREADGKTPDGVLEETAFMAAGLKVMPKMGEAGFDALALAGMRAYAENGYTFAEEGSSMKTGDEARMGLAKSKKMLIDVVSYPDMTFADDPFGLDSPWYSPKLNNGYRIAGVKLSFDGSPQGKTAFLSQPYFVHPSANRRVFEAIRPFRRKK